MAEFMIVAIFVSIILLIVTLVIRHDMRENRRGREELSQAWDKYYAETRKFKKMDSVVITYENGEIETVEDVGYFFVDKGEGFIHFYDKYEKTIKTVNKNHVIGVNCIRSDEYTDGSRRLDDL